MNHVVAPCNSDRFTHCDMLVIVDAVMTNIDESV